MGGYIESYRGHVLSSECDLFGHMNVQFYNACISQAMASTFNALGLNAEQIKEHQRGFAVVEQNSRFYAELLAGDIIHMHSGVLKTSSKTVTIHHRLINSTSDEVCFESTLTAAHMDLSARKAIELDETILSKIDTLRISEEAA